MLLDKLSLFMSIYAWTLVSSAGRQFLPLSGLGVLADSLGPGILVHATSNGDIATVQAYLDKNPHQVCTCTLTLQRVRDSPM